MFVMKKYHIETRKFDRMNSASEDKPRISNNLISSHASSLAPCTSRRLNCTAASRTMSAITIALLIAACACSSALAYSYDPEQQDGIPVFSARSVQRPTSSSSSHDDEWSNNGDSELMSAAPNRPMPTQRRQSDADLDDGLEDEEEDEYKSGSSPHESIESPSYGESRRFARDGDDIEEFFDRHLGPPQEAAVTAESSPGGSQYMVPASDPDDEDEYEAAASGPLATIFHSLLGHHDHKHSKRPFLQIATSSSTDSGDSSSDADTSPGSKSSKGNLKASQSAQSYVEAAPIALALTPVAAPSTITVQEPAGQESQESGGHEQEASGHPGGVREIYIGRRPTVMSYLQQAQAVQQQASLPAYYSAGSANVWRGPNGRPMVYEQEQSANYARHPMAASHAYQREQPTGASSAASPVADDEQTVTYGLSFGGGGGSSEAKDETGADQEAADHPGDDAGAADMPDAQQAGYVPYNTKYTTSSTRAHNNYYQQQYGPTPTGYVRVYPHQQSRYYQPQQMMMVQQQQPQYQQQYAAGATRYHRDPSESTNHLAAMRAAHMGISYNGAQHRGLGQQTNAQAGAYGEQRRRLLASLDREIKASPQYRQNTAAAATALTNMYTRRPPLRAVKKNHLTDGDLDTFNSYHSEVDPYRTFTKTSRMINGGDPLAFLANTRQAAVQSESRSQSQPESHGRSTQSDAPYQGKSQESHAIGANDNKSTSSPVPSGSIEQNPGRTLLTGPLTNYDSQSTGDDLLRTTSQSTSPETLANKDGQTLSGDETNNGNHGLSRVRRDDSEDREIDDDNDDDGVWVDDDGDDDNKQQSSDLNETSQEPEEEGDGEEEDGQQDAANNVPSAQQVSPPGVIGAPHGYELWPNDAMVYNG